MFANAITWRPFGTHRINKRLSCQLRGARFGFPIARAAIEIVAVVCLMLRHNRRPLPEPAFHIFTDAVAARAAPPSSFYVLGFRLLHVYYADSGYSHALR
jgi:hypothetical protein